MDFPSRDAGRPGPRGVERAAQMTTRIDSPPDSSVTLDPTLSKGRGIAFKSHVRSSDEKGVHRELEMTAPAVTGGDPRPEEPWPSASPHSFADVRCHWCSPRQCSSRGCSLNSSGFPSCTTHDQWSAQVDMWGMLRAAHFVGWGYLGGGVHDGQRGLVPGDADPPGPGRGVLSGRLGLKRVGQPRHARPSDCGDSVAPGRADPGGHRAVRR